MNDPHCDRHDIYNILCGDCIQLKVKQDEENEDE